MHYQDPFVYYLNISAAIILFLLALPTLLNKREVFKVRLAYFMIFFSVIATFFINLFIFYPENEKLVEPHIAGNEYSNPFAKGPGLPGCGGYALELCR